MSRVKIHPPVFLAVAHTWLRHPGKPELSMRVVVDSLDSLTQPITQSILPILSRPRPIAVNDGARKSWTGSISLLLESQPERAAFVQLVKDGSPLLFVAPAGWGWDFTSGYMSLGTVAWSNPSNRGAEPDRIATAPFVLVDRPANLGGITATIVSG